MKYKKKNITSMDSTLCAIKAQKKLEKLVGETYTIYQKVIEVHKDFEGTYDSGNGAANWDLGWRERRKGAIPQSSEHREGCHPLETLVLGTPFNRVVFSFLFCV